MHTHTHTAAQSHTHAHCEATHNPYDLTFFLLLTIIKISDGETDRRPTHFSVKCREDTLLTEEGNRLLLLNINVSHHHSETGLDWMTSFSLSASSLRPITDSSDTVASATVFRLWPAKISLPSAVR